MAPTNVSSDFSHGVASFQSEEFFNRELLSGENPPISWMTGQVVGQNTDLAAFTVVGRTGNAPGGALIKATYVGTLSGPDLDVASQLMTFTTPPDADDTITIGSVVYTWKATPGATANHIKTGATNTLAADALVAAINDDATDPLLYGTATVAHPQVYAVKESATLVRVYALAPGVAGNSIATTQTGDESAWSGATLTGGIGAGVVAIGILPSALLTGSGVTTTSDVICAGCFNPDALVWDASFDTDAKKKVAFEGAPSPTNITILKPKFTETYP